MPEEIEEPETLLDKTPMYDSPISGKGRLECAMIGSGAIEIRGVKIRDAWKE